MAYTAQDRRNHIRELQQYLYALSFYDDTIPRVIPDGIYGRETALAVRAFQQKHGLRPNGETNRATWDAIASTHQSEIEKIASPLHVFSKSREIIGMGEVGFSVLIVQSILKTLKLRFHNMQEIQINGIYDEATQAAIRLFQQNTGCSTTGNVDRCTWNVLVAAIESAIL